MASLAALLSFGIALQTLEDGVLVSLSFSPHYQI